MKQGSRWAAAIAAALLVLAAAATTAPAASDFSQEATAADGGALTFRFTPTTPSGLVDVHYLVNGANQQNFRMANAGGTWTKTTVPLPAGATIDYWFTYEKNGPLYDSQHFSTTAAGTGTTTPAPTPSPAPTPTPTPSAGADFAQDTAAASGGALTFRFTPTTPSGLVDVHYLVNGANQQNFRMASAAGTWTKTTVPLPAGATVDYWFTYEKNGPLYDSQRFSTTSAGGSGTTTPTPRPTPSPTPTPTPTDGSFPLTVRNDTNGRWSDAQVYLTVLGQATPGHWSYLRPDGTLAPIDHRMASAPGHLTKNGADYPNMSFTLAQAKTVQLPSLEGGRIYVSVGSPMYLPVSPDDSGWGGPDPRNPTDPNATVYYDWYEYSYRAGTLPFGGNTTQVDGFGLPLTARLQQTSSGYDRTTGITLSRAEVWSRYRASVGAAFTPLAGTYRIEAPRSDASFDVGGAQASYLAPAIDAAWSTWARDGFALSLSGRTFRGTIVDGRLRFTKNGAGSYTLSKPTTHDVMQCAGALASPGMSPVELELGADLCAAFNRGVGATPSSWYSPSAYYPSAVRHNDYAAFFHAIGIGGRSYGFAYDDVNDQSSVTILPNAQPPTRLTIGVGW